MPDGARPGYVPLLPVPGAETSDVLVRCERVSHGEWLKVGDTYHVLEMLILPGRGTLVRILGDHGSPGVWSLSMFTQVTDTIPGNWIVHMLDNGGVEFTPSRWSEGGFWESYFDDDADACASFASELALIRAADPVGSSRSRREYGVPPSESRLWQLLRDADDPDYLERPADYGLRRVRDRFEQLVRRLDAAFECRCEVDRDVQDASFYGRITVPAAATAASRSLVVVVSNFGDFVVLAVDNPGVWTAAEMARLLHPDDAERIYEALGDLRYVLIPEEPLWRAYDGARDFGRADTTWWIRYFDYL